MTALENLHFRRSGARDTHGPYFIVSEWLETRLDLSVEGLRKRIADQIELQSDDADGFDELCICCQGRACCGECVVVDEDYLSELRGEKTLVERLRVKLLEVFSDELDKADETVLWHPDLSEREIFVNQEGEITRMGAWKDAITVPLWRCYELPKFLWSRPREIEPVRDQYAALPEEARLHPLRAGWKDNEGKEDQYWLDLAEFEKTKLRRVYLDAMESLCPGFTQRMEQYKPLIDVIYAVRMFEDSGGHFLLEQWLDASDAGADFCLKDKHIELSSCFD